MRYLLFFAFVGCGEENPFAKDDDGDGFYFSIYSHEGCLNNVQAYDFTAGGMYHSWPQDGQTTDDMPDGSTYIVTFLERFDINGLRSSTNIN